MRIRKHASKILGIASTLPSPPLVVTDPIPVENVCTLNQSPWDVYPFHPPTPPPSDDKQEGGYVGDEINGEKHMFVANSAAAVLNDEALVPWSREVSNYMGEENDPVQVLNKVDKVKGKRVSEKKAKTEECWITARDGARSTFTCKKTDDKQWRCERLAPKPNSLCDYHLAQIKSYNCKAPSPSDAKATSISKSTHRKRVTMPPSTSVVSDIYYYSSFGPWRGKQRGGGDIGKHRSVKDESDSEQGSCNVDVSADGKSCQDSEMEVKQMWKDTATNGRKKRKKPLKSRSLKSLM